MNRLTRTIHMFVRVPVLALALCTGAVALTSVAPAFAAPVIDGNLTDFIAYGQSLNSSHTGFGVAIVDKGDAQGNPQPETIYNDPKFIPCPTVGGNPPPLLTHWVNGFEIFNHYLDYVPGTKQLYLAIRSEGFIGDSDGDDDPDARGTAAGCNPADNVDDPVGIGGNELYAWQFDLNCDGIIDAGIKIQDGQVVGSQGFAGVTGTFAFKKDPITGATGHDLEVLVNLLSPLPAAFDYVRAESNSFDGLSEDRSDGIPLIGNPAIAVLKDANPASIC